MSCPCNNVNETMLAPRPALTDAYGNGAATVPTTSPPVLRTSSNGAGSIQSWEGLSLAQPADICSLIAYANIGETAGKLVSSSDFATPAAPWTANTAYISGAPVCYALRTDDMQKVYDARQWNICHLTYSSDPSVTPPPLLNTVFLRGGTQWRNDIPIAMPTGLTIANIQISFFDNAATRGDNQGTIPAVEFTGSFTSVQTLSVTLRENFANHPIGIRFIDDAGTKYVFFDCRWWVVK